MTPFALDLRKECVVSALCAEVLEEPKEPWMEMSCCKNCECEKTDHTDEGHCLFAPMTFEAMTPEAFLQFLSRTLKGLNVPPSKYPVTNIALSPQHVPYYEPSYTWAPYTMNIVTPSSYTLCGSLVA